MRQIIISIFAVLISVTATTVSAGFFNDLGGALSNAGNSLGNAINKSVDNKKGGASHKTKFESGLKGTLLDELFIDTPYDKNIDGEKQWPRVALTVHDEPTFHTKLKPSDSSDIEKGCWKLSAVIWQDQKTSKNVEPFEWCTPDHVAYGVAMSSASMWFSWSADLSYNKTTGPKRTNGPIPPSMPIPSDVRHKRYLKNDHMSAQYYDGLMMISVLYQMGVDWSVVQDKRVWVVKFDNAYK
jgi:hypothetical protein